MNEQINILLKNNNISYELFLLETYNCFLVSLLEAIIDECESDKNEKIRLSNRIRQSQNSILTIKNIINEKFKCIISDNEASLILKWFKAYLTKNNIRKIWDKTTKKKLLFLQDEVCNICNCKINMNDSEVDHIIPFSFVGDELGEENLQLLCVDCNRRKSNNITYNLKMFLVNKNN